MPVTTPTIRPLPLPRPTTPGTLGTTGPQHQPTFKGLSLPPQAKSQFLRDILGVWLPKVPLTRSKTQFFEDAFLENVENVAFYLAVPMGAPVFANILQKLYKLPKELDTKAIGSAWSELPKGALEKGGPLVGAKAGVVLAVLTLAAGWEYMVQHVKNVITAKEFDTKNFAAVAGLEAGKTVAQQGEMDPVVKAKRRAWQVASLMAGGFGLAAATPFLVKNSKVMESLAKKALTIFHFDSNKKKGVFFDLTKPMLAMLAGIGAVSYIDAARDPLERRETKFRLALVIPYMLAGKELAGNLLAKIMENSTIDVEEDGVNKPQKVKALLEKYYKGTGLHPSFLKGDRSDLWKQFKNPETLLNLNMVKDSLASEFDQVAKKTGKAIPTPVQEAILKKHGSIGMSSYLLSALLCGIGINLLAYHQTKKRYELQQQQLKQQQRVNTVRPPQAVNSPFGARAGFSGQQPVRPQSPFVYGAYQQVRFPQQAPVPVGYVRPVAGFNAFPNYAWPPEQSR